MIFNKRSFVLGLLHRIGAQSSRSADRSSGGSATSTGLQSIDTQRYEAVTGQSKQGAFQEKPGRVSRKCQGIFMRQLGKVPSGRNAVKINGNLLQLAEVDSHSCFEK